MGAGASAAGGASLLAGLGDTIDEAELRGVASRVGLDFDTFEDWLATVKDFAEFPLQKEKIERQYSKWAEAQSQTADYDKRIQASEEAVIGRQLEKIMAGPGVDGLSELPASLRSTLIPVKTSAGGELAHRGELLLEKLFELLLRDEEPDDMGHEFEHLEKEAKDFLAARVKAYADAFADLHAPASHQALEFIQALHRMYSDGYRTVAETTVAPDPDLEEWKAAAQGLRDRIAGTKLKQNRNELMDMYIDAYELRPVVTPLLKTLATAAGAVLRAPPLKDLFRAVERLVVGKKDNLFDLLRFTVECIDMRTVNRVTTAVFDHADFKVERIKDRFSQPSETGWMDVVLNVVYMGKPKNRHRFEVCVKHHAFVGMFQSLGGQTMYNSVRAVAESVDTVHGAEKRRSALAEFEHKEKQQVQAAEAEQKQQEAKEEALSIYHGEMADGKAHGHGTMRWAKGGPHKSYVGGWIEALFDGEGTLVSAMETYTGSFKAGQKDGRGKLTANDGYTYEGEFQKDLRHGNGREGFPNGDEFKGEFKKDARSEGVFTWDTGGMVYSGEWKDGKWHGTGTHTNNTTQETYSGDFIAGERHGKGDWALADGTKYSGDWKNGVREGHGSETLPDGTKYTGFWKDGKYNCGGLQKGTLTLPSGEEYAGHFNDGIKEGTGTVTLPDGTKYNGRWEGGQWNGKGTLTLPDGTKYNGNFKDGVRNGRGQQTWPDKATYDGDWVDGKRHGQGTEVSADKVKYVGAFEGDMKHGAGKIIQGLKATPVQFEHDKQVGA